MSPSRIVLAAPVLAACPADVDPVTSSAGDQQTTGTIAPTSPTAGGRIDEVTRKPE